MAQDVITRFKLETTAFDSKIKQAAKELSDYSKTATQAKEGFNQFTKANVDAAKALGTMETSTVKAKDRANELVGAFNEAAKAYNALSNEQKQSDFAKALSESLTQLQQRISETKQEMMGIGNVMDDMKSKSSGIFGEGGLTGMLQVTGGNLISQGITKLGAEIGDTIQQSVELARSGEGIRIAFERLNQPGLLDNLKEATHGTVSELDLMKQAVKFDNFNLSLEQMGTMLAFAQQQAKDTGQSVDYMVDSIVTGLGRKSLPILDNLGLSATEIRERMKETGDMTKAVADIIRDRMEAAGGYVETAADRAARAAANAQNQMEEIGRKAMPVAEQWAEAWNTIKIGGIDLLNTVFGPLARSAAQIQSILNGVGFKFKAGIPNLADGPAPSPSRQPGKDHRVQASGGYVVVSDTTTGKVIGQRHFDDLSNVDDWRSSLARTPMVSGGKTGKTNIQFADDSIMAQEKLISDLTQKWKTVSGEMRDGYLKDLEEAQKKLAEMTGKVKGPDLDAMFPDMSKQNYNTGYAGSTRSKIDSARADMAMGPVNMESINAYISGIKSALSDADLGSDLYNSLTENLKDASTMSSVLQAAIASGVSGTDLTDVASELKQKLLEGDIDEDAWQDLLDRLNEMITDSDLKLVFDVDTDAVETAGQKMKKSAEQTQKAWNLAAQSISNIGTALNSIEDPGVKAAGTVIKAIADIAGGFAAASVQAGSLGPFGWLAWLAAGTAAMATTISTVHSLTGFANGGIVPGNSFSGDNLHTADYGINSGELILNRAQQDSIAGQLQDNEQSRVVSARPYLDGELVYLGMQAYLRRSGMGEIVTTNE